MFVASSYNENLLGQFKIQPHVEDWNFARESCRTVVNSPPDDGGVRGTSNVVETSVVIVQSVRHLRD